MAICFLVAAITFKLPKGKGGVCGHLLGLSINNIVAMSPTIVTPYVYKDSLVVIETILMALIQLFFGLTCTFKQ